MFKSETMLIALRGIVQQIRRANIIRPMIMQTFNPRIRDLPELTVSRRRAPDTALLTAAAAAVVVVVAYVAVGEKPRGSKESTVSHRVGYRQGGYYRSCFIEEN